MKYRLTEETKEWCGVVLHRIECVTAFGNVKAGDKGGWIEKESNLSQDGNAWVSGNARYIAGVIKSKNTELKKIVYEHMEYIIAIPDRIEDYEQQKND